MPPEIIRVSVGTASVLGLVRARLKVPPTTAYLMGYTEGPCQANCGFCPQSQASHGDRNRLSRVTWPPYPLNQVLEAFRRVEGGLARICFQVVRYPGFLEDLLEVLRLLKGSTRLPISVDTCPVGREGLERLREAGVDRVSIPLDGATEEVFNRVKGLDVGGPYRWEETLRELEAAVEVFGRGRVGTNIIVGLGESEEEAVRLIWRLHQMGVVPALFAFTPIPGTPLEGHPPPELGAYRRIQLARYLLVNNLGTLGDVVFQRGRVAGFRGVGWEAVAATGAPFMTSGCPGCNRPFYNERPSGPFYNYPRPLTREEAEMELGRLGLR